MTVGISEEYEEKKPWIEDYIKKWEKLRGPEHPLTEEDKEIARRCSMQTLRLHETHPTKFARWYLQKEVEY